MFRLKYTIPEVARLLKRSKSAVTSDIARGRLKTQGRLPSARALKPSSSVQVFVNDLKRYLGDARAKMIFGGGEERKEEVVAKRKDRTFAPGRYKQCRTCGRIKPVTDFVRDQRYKDWLSPDCKACIIQRQK